MTLTNLKQAIKKIPGIGWLHRQALPSSYIEHGPQGVKQAGHRRYVGGMWDEIGKLQFDYVVSQGLQPHDYLLDIACGSLRAGVHFISYLDPGHYLGIEKEKLLIDAGIENELSQEAYQAKQPQFVVSDQFEFEKFNVKPNYAIAQSLFTHLPIPIIEACFEKLRPHFAEDGVFLATYFESPTKLDNPSQPHDHGNFKFTRQQMESFGRSCGWKARYIGDWNHPRSQVMVHYRPV